MANEGAEDEKRRRETLPKYFLGSAPGYGFEGKGEVGTAI